MQYTLLIAEDDPDIVDMLSLYLESNDYRILHAGNGADALELLQHNHIDLALVDIMMPQMDGYEMIREARKETNIPVIIMSARNFDTDKVKGLNLGADAYITKPFNPFEMIAYIKALLRRYYQLGNVDTPPPSPSNLSLGNLELNADHFTARKDGTLIALTTSEFRILSQMMRHPGRVFTKAQLLECISSDIYSESDENTITVHISNLRAKIGNSPTDMVQIRTIRGLGYKIEAKN